MIGARQLEALAELLDDPETTAHVRVMTGLHRKWSRDNGYAVPPVVEILEMAARASAQKRGAAEPGQNRPIPDAENVVNLPSGQAGTNGRNFYSRTEVAAMSGKSERTIRRLIAAGKLPASPLGIPREALERLTNLKEIGSCIS